MFSQLSSHFQNIPSYWKAGSGTVPLHLRVTTGTTSASVTQLSTSISALERENNREKSAVFLLEK